MANVCIHDQCNHICVAYNYTLVLAYYLDCIQWKPGSPWDSNWKFCINLYISAASDVMDVVKIFMEVSRLYCTNVAFTETRF